MTRNSHFIVKIKTFILVAITILGVVFMLLIRSESRQGETIEVFDVVTDGVKDYGKGAPKTIILWTSWRSGSTFLGHLLTSAVKDTFYSPEPVHWVGAKVLQNNDSMTYKAFRYLYDLVHCEISSVYEEVLLYMTGFAYYKRWSKYFFSDCIPKGLCKDPDYVSEMCRNASVHVVKIIRLPLKWALPLLKDEKLNLQVIYLVRDPRAVLMSRLQFPTWCEKKTCGDAPTVCGLIKEDLTVAATLLEMYPKKFKIFQYEHINKDPYKGLQEVMSFVNLTISQDQLKALRPNILEPYEFESIKKNATMMVDAWRPRSPFQIVHYYQETCAEVISKLGLRFFDSETELRNLSLPLLLSDADLK